MSDICSICKDPIPDEVDFALCSVSECKLHFTCAGITEHNWKRIGAKRRNEWKCNLCSSKTTPASGGTSNKLNLQLKRADWTPWVRRTGSERDKADNCGSPHGIKQITMFIRENVECLDSSFTTTTTIKPVMPPPTSTDNKAVRTRAQSASEMQAIESKLDLILSEISEIKSDNAVLKTDINLIKNDNKEFKADISKTLDFFLNKLMI
ncbi:hypothetical protein J6590_041049 [Homalodisca vitripennis]|nr:hypothetical protein J6590_041049 [Homalodisca vitripennis]